MEAFFISFSTLTLLPLSPKGWKSTDLKNSVAFYPLVGAFLGGILALLSKIHLSHELKTPILLLAWIVITAAFHLDGLADCCDGFFGGKNPEERRRIMRDPAIGAYGVTGIVLTLLFKFSLLSRFLAEGDSWKWLILIALAARWAVTLACVVFKAPPGDHGLGSQVVGLAAPLFAVSSLLSLVAGMALLKFQGLEIFALVGLVALAVGYFSKSRIKGLTGDGMGTIIELSEVSSLFWVVLIHHEEFLQL